MQISIQHVFLQTKLLLMIPTRYCSSPISKDLSTNTCMSSQYIQAQALTLTKAHEEHIGPLSAIANSAKCYGHADPVVAFSDDPVKVC